MRLIVLFLYVNNREEFTMTMIYNFLFWQCDCNMDFPNCSYIFIVFYDFLYNFKYVSHGLYIVILQ